MHEESKMQISVETRLKIDAVGKTEYFGNPIILPRKKKMGFPFSSYAVLIPPFCEKKRKRNE